MTTSDKIALASFIIAALSFILTIAVIYLTNRHNRLTVKPIFKLIPYDTEDYIAVFIKNSGTGPMLRNKMTIKNNSLTATSLIDLMPSHQTIKWTNFSKFEEFVIPANETETLIEIKGDSNNKDFNDYKMQIRRALKDISISCEYADIYGQKFKSELVKLDYCYGRHF
ncbi:MAG: hypothetical protein IT232_12590 [Flavobacteriales bacterium]|nr:hypothetical protein [Flavobacteriales bacterium]